MKTFSTELQEHLSGGVTTLCICVKVARRDGTVLGFTNLDDDLVIDGVTYQAGAFSTTQVKNQAAPAASNFDVMGLLDSDLITEDDLIAGRYDGAHVTSFIQNWADLTMQSIPLVGYLIGQVERRDTGFTAEIRGLGQALQTTIGSATSLSCRAGFGSTGSGSGSGCRFKVAPAAWQASHLYAQRKARDEATGDVVSPSVESGWDFVCTTPGHSGSVEPSWNTGVGATTTDNEVVWTARRATTRTAQISAVVSMAAFSVDGLLGDLTDGTGGSKTGGFFAEGTVRFTSGANAGVTLDIQSFASNGDGSYAIGTKLPFPLAIAPGDAVVLQAGCDKTHAVCRDNYDNDLNERNERLLPGQDTLFKVTKSATSGSKK